MIRTILVATHGSKGAVEAERCALDLAATHDAELHALYVIHKGWGSLVGIEWLHSSEKRMDFYRYAEAELYKMADAALGKFVQRAAACGVKVTTSVRVGDPGEVILSEARERGSDLIVIGDACKGRSEEYKAKINVGKLLRSAPCSVLQAKVLARGKDTALTGEACASRLQGIAQG
ncbi:MAG: universal stress protein [Nitrospirota bacterium]